VVVAVAGMTPKPVADADRDPSTPAWRQLSAQRCELIPSLIAAGYSPTDIAPEMGVIRQAMQKTLATG
jgi:hypothetical protein